MCDVIRFNADPFFITVGAVIILHEGNDLDVGQSKNPSFDDACFLKSFLLCELHHVFLKLFYNLHFLALKK